MKAPCCQVTFHAIIRKCVIQFLERNCWRYQFFGRNVMGRHIGSTFSSSHDRVIKYVHTVTIVTHTWEWSFRENEQNKLYHFSTHSNFSFNFSDGTISNSSDLKFHTREIWSWLFLIYWYMASGVAHFISLVFRTCPLFFQFWYFRRIQYFVFRDLSACFHCGYCRLISVFPLRVFYILQYRKCNFIN